MSSLAIKQAIFFLKKDGFSHFLKPNLNPKIKGDTLALRGVINRVLVSCIGIDEGIFSYLVIHP